MNTNVIKNININIKTNIFNNIKLNINTNIINNINMNIIYMIEVGNLFGAPAVWRQ